MSIVALLVGERLLEGLRDSIGHEEYDKIMSSPIKGCKCGFIEEGNETLCPKCEGEGQ